MSTSSTARSLGDRLRNWGRWGPDDELGTLNYITADKRRDAASLVRKGSVFSLQIPMGRRGPMTGARVNPIHTMTATGVDQTQRFPTTDGAKYTDDTMFLYLQSGTEWDALSHVFYDDKLYNGYPASTVDSNGAQRNSIEKAASSFVSRGVLLDVARHRGVECLDADVRITAADLTEVEAAQDVVVSEGDILLVRTGVLAEWGRTGSWARYHQSHAGLALDSLEWLHDRRVAAVASDNGAVEGVDKEASELAIPLHMVALRDMGMTFGETFYLEELAADCAQDDVWEFLLVAPALRIEGAVGSPVNPIAMK